jgi:predicted O-methyltransferase YrrM
MRTSFLARAESSLVYRLARLARGLTLRRHLAARGIEGALAIPSHTTRDELQQLFFIASACPEGSTVVEIGSYLGASTCFIAAGLAKQQGRLICVDTWQNETMPEGERDTFAEFQQNIAPVRDRVTIMRKRSEDLGPGDLPQPIRFAFVDADHSYGAVRRDAEIICPLIAAGGVLAFHDVLHFVGVSKVVGELLQTGDWHLAGCVNNLAWLRQGGFEK